jgi:hypothetical protein
MVQAPQLQVEFASVHRRSAWLSKRAILRCLISAERFRSMQILEQPILRAHHAIGCLAAEIISVFAFAKSASAACAINASSIGDGQRSIRKFGLEQRATLQSAVTTKGYAMVAGHRELVEGIRATRL